MASDTSIGRHDLLEAIVEHAESQRTLVEEVWEQVDDLLPAPANLAGIFPVVDHIAQCQENLRNLLPSDRLNDANHLARWVELVGQIPSRHPLRGEPLLTAKRQRGGRYSSPVRGNISDFPIWAMLWPQAPNNEDQPEYLSLQAHLLAAHLIAQRNDETARKIKRVRWDAAGRFVRLLGITDGKEAFDYVRPVLANTPTSTSHLFGVLLAIRHDDGSFEQGIRNASGSLAEILAIVHGIDPGGPIFRESSGRRSGSGRRRQSLPINHIGPDHDYYTYFEDRRAALRLDSDGHATLAIDTPDEEAAKRLVAAGLSPDEFDQTNLATISANDLFVSESGKQVSLQSVALLGRAQAHHIAGRAQRLKLSISRVRLATIRSIVITLEQMWQAIRQKEESLASGKSLSSEDQLEKSLIYLTASCLVTGEEPSSVSACLLIKSIDELPSSFRFAANPDHRVWIRPYEAPSRKALGGEATRGLVQTAPRIILPDLFQLTTHLDLIDTENLGRMKKNWKSAIGNKLLKNGAPRSWANLERIPHILPSWWSGLREADHLPALLLFRNSDRLANALNHYTAVDRINLAKQYQAVMKALWKDLKLPTRVTEPANDRLFSLQPVDLDQYDRSWTGDDRVPRVNTVAGLLNHLQAEIAAFRKPRDLKDWVARHNTYTTYLGVTLAVVTGLRAIRTPITRLSAIHRPSGTIILREKDQVDGAHARFAFLPERVLKLVDAYRSHLFRLRGVWPLSSSMLLRVPATKARDRSRYDTSSFDLDLFDTLFYLQERNGNFIAEEFSGQALKRECDRRIANAWPSPNAGRHFLRTYLVTTGLDPNLINCLMGHWGYGEDPYVANSTLDPMIARREIFNTLDELLDHIQFKTVRLR